VLDFLCRLRREEVSGLNVYEIAHRKKETNKESNYFLIGFGGGGGGLALVLGTSPMVNSLAATIKRETNKFTGLVLTRFVMFNSFSEEDSFTTWKKVLCTNSAAQFLGMLRG